MNGNTLDSKEFDKLREFLTDDFILFVPSFPEPLNQDVLVRASKAHYVAFPNWTHTIEEIIAEKNKVGVRLMQNGSHEAEYKGILPTGKKVTNPGMHFMTFEDGKVREWWAIEDDLGLKQQLGMELKMKEVIE